MAVLAVMVLFVLMIPVTSQAVSSGEMTITGISTTTNEIIVFASSYSGGSNPGECAATDWWWPAGTQYAFWVSRTGNELLYTQLLNAWLEGKGVWIHAPLAERLNTFGNGVPCRIDPSKGLTAGN